MTAKTPVHQLEYLVQGEPVRAMRPAMEANAKTIEAALIAGGVAAPGAADLLQVAGRVTALEGAPVHVTEAAGPTALSALSTVGLRAGDRVFCTDTKADALWDGTRWLFFDTAWQNYTLKVSTSPAPFAEIAYGNAVRYGQFYRSGREVSVRGYFQIASGTGYNGLNGTLHIGFPAGYAPKLAPVAGAGTGVNPIGTARIVGSVIANGAVTVEGNAAAAQRWFLFLTATDLVLTGGSTTTNLSLVNHYVHFQGSYETGFEA